MTTVNEAEVLLEELRFDDLCIGDMVVDWRHATGQYRNDNRLDYKITQITNESLYIFYGSDSRSRWAARLDDLFYCIKRTVVLPVKRVPCSKCGKSLHPELSGQKGFTHGC